jgi:plastocyanin
MKISRRTKILVTSISAPILFIVAFVIVIVLYNNFHQPQQIDITTAGFAPQSIEISEGQTLRFVNQSSTIIQVLCVGTNQHCDPSSPLPAGLKSAVHIAPNQAKDVLFDSFGTFTITDTAAPRMNLTVTVDAAV